MLPSSRKEARELGDKRYNDGKKCRNGHFSDRLTSTGQCCECKNEYQAKLREADPEALRAKEKAYYERHREERLHYHSARYHSELKDNPQYWNERKANDLAQSAARRAVTRKAKLEGYASEITEIYKQCPEGHHVDHIVPLRGQYVCGLHVPWNLQYLTAEDNLKKGNRYDFEKY